MKRGLGNCLIGSLKLLALAYGLGAASAGHAQETAGVLGTYPFADHASMHYRTEPLLMFLQQRQTTLQLDVTNSYDELLRRAVKREYAALQVPAHFGLHLKRCCGYRIVAGWQGPISILWLVREESAPPADSKTPVTLAVASLLSLSAVAMTGGCASQFTVDDRLHMLVPSGSQERALQALLRGRVDGALVSGTTLRALKPDLRKRFRVVKEVSGLPGDVFMVQDTVPVPAWQLALEKEFPDSALATEMQRRWYRPQGVVAASELQLQAAQAHSEPLAECLRTVPDAGPSISLHH